MRSWVHSDLSSAGVRILAAAVLAIWASVVAARPSLALELRWQGPDHDLIDARQLSLAELESLPQQVIATTTPWTRGVQNFSGPTLADLSRLTGQAPHEAELHALNDYSVVVPAEDWERFNIILATRIDGRIPRVFEKGPYWLIYPVDKMQQPLAQKYVSRMIWQVDNIEFHTR